MCSHYPNPLCLFFLEEECFGVTLKKLWWLLAAQLHRSATGDNDANHISPRKGEASGLFNGFLGISVISLWFSSPEISKIRHWYLKLLLDMLTDSYFPGMKYIYQMVLCNMIFLLVTKKWVQINQATWYHQLICWSKTNFNTFTMLSKDHFPTCWKMKNLRMQYNKMHSLQHVYYFSRWLL